MTNTFDEMVEDVDRIIDALAYHDDKTLVAVELAHQLRDELIRHSSIADIDGDDYDD